MELVAAFLGAIVGSIAGGAVADHLAHVREQRYAARTMRAWLVASLAQLRGYVRIDESDGREVWTWTSFALPPCPVHADVRLAQALPTWLTDAVLFAETGVEGLRAAIAMADDDCNAALQDRRTSTKQLEALVDQSRSTVRGWVDGSLPRLERALPQVEHFLARLEVFHAAEIQPPR